MRRDLVWPFLSAILAICSANPDLNAQHGELSDLLARHSSGPHPLSIPAKEELTEEAAISSPKPHSSRPRLNRQGGNRWRRHESAIFEHRPSISKVQLNRQKAGNDRTRQESLAQAWLTRQGGQRWRRDADAFLEKQALYERGIESNDAKTTGSANPNIKSSVNQLDSAELPPPLKSVNAKQDSASRFQDASEDPQTPSSYNTLSSQLSPSHPVSKNGKDTYSDPSSPLRSPKQSNSPKGHSSHVDKDFGNKGLSQKHKHHSPKSGKDKSKTSSSRTSDTKQGKQPHSRRDVNADHLVARFFSALGYGKSDTSSTPQPPNPARKFTRQKAGRFYPAHRRAVPEVPLAQNNAQLHQRQAAKPAQSNLQESSKQCSGTGLTSQQSAESSNQQHQSRSADAEQASHVSHPSPQQDPKAQKPTLASKDKDSSKKDQDSKAKDKAVAKNRGKHRKSRKHKKKGKKGSTSNTKGVTKKKSAAEKSKADRKKSAAKGKAKKKSKLLKDKDSTASQNKSKAKVDSAKNDKDGAGEKQTNKEKTVAKKIEDKEKQEDRKEDEMEKKKEAEDDKKEKKLEKGFDDMEKDDK